MWNAPCNYCRIYSAVLWSLPALPLDYNLDYLANAERALSAIFPEPVTKLPMAEMPFPGVKAYLSQSDDHQIIFMEFDQAVEVPAHAHAAQWGIVLEGKIDITIGGEEYVFTKGDRYFIPSGVIHSAKIHPGYTDVTFFDEPNRYHRK